MIKVCFVCHGNICRSPMAEFFMKKYVNEQHIEDQFHIISRATSSEEIGNDISFKTAKVLDSNNISHQSRSAQRIDLSTINNYDYILYMEDFNLYNLKRLFQIVSKNVIKLSYWDNNIDIEDPYYSGRYDFVFEQIKKSIICFVNYLKKNGKIII